MWHCHPDKELSFDQVVSNSLEPRNRRVIESTKNAHTTVSETGLVVRIIAVVIQPRTLRHFVLPQLPDEPSDRHILANFRSIEKQH